MNLLIKECIIFILFGNSGGSSILLIEKQVVTVTTEKQPGYLTIQVI